jgi:hypothetical protein
LPGSRAASATTPAHSRGCAIESSTRDPAQLFTWFEQARARNLRYAMRGSTAPPTLDAVQGRLPEGSALVEYWIGDARLAVLWVTRGGSGVVDRAWTTEDAASVRAYNWRVSAALLGRIPWSGVRRVAIVPDGVPHLLPFEALPMDASGTLLIERMAVSYLPSASLLFRDEAPRTALPPWRRQMAAFGIPSGTLPEAAGELRSIARALPGRAALYSGPTDLKRICSATRSRAHRCCISRHTLRSIWPTRIVPACSLRRSPIARPPSICFAAKCKCCRSKARTWSPSPRARLRPGAWSAAKAYRVSAVRFWPRAHVPVSRLYGASKTATAEFMRVFYRSLGQGRGKADALRDAKLNSLHRGGAWAKPQT